MRFEGKSVVVTGAASGMGRLCAECFAKEGARVALSDVNAEALQAAADGIRANGGEAIGIPCDVRRYEEVRSLCDRAAEAFGGIDIIVCMAGGASARVFNCVRDFHDYPVEYFDWGIDVNLKGPLYCAHAAMGYMAKKRSGVVILIGSIAGEEGTDASIDYAASKSALMSGALKSLAQNGARYNIRVNTVSPGPVLTRAAMGKMKTLMGRAAQPQEVVNVILFAASDEASFMTGTNIMVDGGRSSMLPS